MVQNPSLCLTDISKPQSNYSSIYFRHYHRHETLKMKKTFNFATHASAKEQRFAVALGVFVGVFPYKSYKHSVTEP